MKIRKFLTGAVVTCAALVATTMPASGQTARAELATPSPQANQSIAPPADAGHESMQCDRKFAMLYTVRGIALYCSSYEDGTRILAIDHTKFPGGMNALTTFLTRADEGMKAKDGSRLWVHYRAPTQKAQTLCNIAMKGNKNAPACQEVVSFEL